MSIADVDEMLNIAADAVLEVMAEAH